MSGPRQRILAAYLNHNEIVQQGQELASMPSIQEKRQFWDDVRRARALRASGLVEAIPALRLESPPSEAAEYLAEVERGEHFMEAFGGTSYEFKLFNLRAALPIQTFANVQPRLTAPSLNAPPREVLEYCLPLDVRLPGELMAHGNGVRFITPRYGIGQNHVRRRLVDRKVVISFEHLNVMNVVILNGRAIILNGTHRALELLRAGHEMAPAVVRMLSGLQEIQWPQGPGIWNIQFLVGQPRPPLVSDFLTDLAVECMVSLNPSVVDVGWGNEPGAAAQPAQFAIQLQAAPAP